MMEPLNVPGPIYTDCVFPFLYDAMAQGQRVALVTLVQIVGSSPRPLGSQMAVSEDGVSVGGISGGCLEPSLILDAISAIQDRSCRLERYGHGSRFIDIRLPCGSGIDVYTDTALTHDMVTEILTARTLRTPVDLVIDTRRNRRWVSRDGQVRPETGDGIFIRPCLPPCRLVIAGAGPIMVSLATLCQVCEIETDLVCSDRATRHFLKQRGFSLNPAVSWDQFAWESLDRWSGAVLLSHEHDGEAEILTRIMTTPVFYAGALGSRRTHGRRCDVMRELGMAQATIDRIKGPVGLDIGAMTPPEIAVAILGDLIASWRKLPLAPATRDQLADRAIAQVFTP